MHQLCCLLHQNSHQTASAPITRIRLLYLSVFADKYLCWDRIRELTSDMYLKMIKAQHDPEDRIEHLVIASLLRSKDRFRTISMELVRNYNGSFEHIIPEHLASSGAVPMGLASKSFNEPPDLVSGG